jgi:hypothetical protein
VNHAGRERGALLAEAIFSLTLGLVLLVALAGAVVGSLRWIVDQWARAEGIDVVLTIWGILDDELRPGIPVRDWRLEGGGAWVDLRGFRGVARVCGPGSTPDRWRVAYRGRRAAEVGRDSILVLGVDGGWRARALEGASDGGGCAVGSGETAELWQWSGSGTPAPVLVRLYERGRYHLAERAFRYQRGAGGRQPLTPERLAPASRFDMSPSGRLQVSVALDRSTGAAAEDRPYVWSVAGSATTLPAGAAP